MSMNSEAFRQAESLFKCGDYFHAIDYYTNALELEIGKGMHAFDLLLLPCYYGIGYSFKQLYDAVDQSVFENIAAEKMGDALKLMAKSEEEKKPGDEKVSMKEAQAESRKEESIKQSLQKDLFQPMAEVDGMRVSACEYLDAARVIMLTNEDKLTTTQKNQYIDVHYWLANFWYEIDDNEAATEDCNKAIELAEQYNKICPEAHMLKGNLLEKKATYQLALDNYMIARTYWIGKLEEFRADKAKIMFGDDKQPMMKAQTTDAVLKLDDEIYDMSTKLEKLETMISAVKDAIENPPEFDTIREYEKHEADVVKERSATLDNEVKEKKVLTISRRKKKSQ
ncbi:hypothetical protein PCE1_004609 [Barthelona sp. PCE]